jgi:rfaE bifunctional protein nucleotidyltransferase chain/domain
MAGRGRLFGTLAHFIPQERAKRLVHAAKMNGDYPCMNPQQIAYGKILDAPALAAESANLRASGRKLVFTNGCFDLLHAGHARYLGQARVLGDALVVAVNSDDSVRRLKGPSRPVNPASDRAEVLSALRAVDYVTVFEETRVTDLIRQIRPSVYVKGGDYTPETLDPEERAALLECGAEIFILPLVPGRSTTTILERSAGF